MKKLFLLIAVSIFTITSCSKDDDPPPAQTQDQLIGTWKYYKEFENGIEQPIDECITIGTLIFSANGTTELNIYEDLGSGDCEFVGTDEGLWENIGNGNYTFTYLDSSGSNTEQITFEADTFYIEYIDDYGTSDTSDDVTYRDVFKKQ